MNAQDEFDFSGSAAGEGFDQWRAQRERAMIELAHQTGLPLNHQVEVWLAGGVRLRGKLQLQEEKLFLPENDLNRLALRVDNLSFSIHEMESCVRLD